MEIHKSLKNLKIYKCCYRHCRDWRETNKGRLPASDHSPTCENYKLKEYVRIFLKEDPNNGYIQEKNDPLPSVEYTGEYGVEPFYLTEDQYKKLDEFQGF